MQWIVGIVSIVVFLLFQTQGIFGGDSGDLVTAAVTGGVPHPPGYPLYTLLGYLTNAIPLFTPAWRVALLSSLPHVITLVLVYKIVYCLTGSRRASLFAVFVLFGNYIFFLYSITPEVFAFLDLFIASITYFSIRLYQTNNNRYLYLLVGVSGLSLTHHHMILFLTPALMWFLWKRKARSSPFAIIFLFFLGLVPYIYIPIAAVRGSIINWDTATSVTNFIRLITRADYGTFISSAAYGSDMISRLLNIKAYGQYMLFDFSYIGIILLLLGVYYGYRTHKFVVIGLMIAWIFLGPLFLFYASFPLAGRFTLGTYERFLLPSYLIVSILVGLGYKMALTKVRILGNTFLKNTSIKTISLTIFSLLLFIYPIVIFSMTTWKFWGLRDDRTADNLGIDILSSVDKNSLLILTNDTPLFITQYVRYALGLRPDVIAVHLSRLSFPDYRNSLPKLFPKLRIPKAPYGTFMSEFIIENTKQYPIYSIENFLLPDGWAWIPHGLVYELYKQDELPSVGKMRDTNLALWSSYHNPRSGILSRYNHLMLSDVVNIYARQRLNFGKILLRAGEINIAMEQFATVITLGSDTQLSDAYLYIGMIHLFDKRCQDALDSFSRAKAQPFASSELPLFESITYRDCVGDPGAAKKFFDVYQRASEVNEIPLDRSQE